MINKKESLNSDGQQFHQYQQKEHSPLTLLYRYLPVLNTSWTWRN